MYIFPFLSYLLLNLGEFLHITDIHLDLNYHIGSPNKCLLGKTGLRCCHNNNIAINHSSPADKWGDYNCDTPFILVNNSLDWINKTYPNLDFILYSGDSVGHHDITQSVNKNLVTIDKVTDLFNKYFTNKLVIPNQGNHDTYPIDQTVPYVESKIRKHLANSWKNMIGQEAANQFMNNGYFRVNISKNLNILSINTLDYDSHNLFKKTTKWDSQTKWLNDTLDDIRSSNSSVYILGHIYPTAGESSSNYNRWFLDYLVKYNDIILGNLFGHSHHDEFKYKPNTSPILVTPSLMPDNRDPCFRIYSYNRSNNQIVDYTQLCINLTKTNNLDNLVVYYDYKLSDLYNINNITITSYENLLERLKTNASNTLQYCRHYLGNNNNCTLDYAQSLISNIQIT